MTKDSISLVVKLSALGVRVLRSSTLSHPWIWMWNVVARPSKGVRHAALQERLEKSASPLNAVFASVTVFQTSWIDEAAPSRQDVLPLLLRCIDWCSIGAFRVQTLEGLFGKSPPRGLRTPVLRYRVRRVETCILPAMGKKNSSFSRTLSGNLSMACSGEMWIYGRGFCPCTQLVLVCYCSTCKLVES